MPPKARGKAQGKASAKTLARRARQRQFEAANERQKKRREALRELNSLTTEIGFAAAPLVLSDNNAVEQRVRALQRRCPDAK